MTIFKTFFFFSFRDTTWKMAKNTAMGARQTATSLR